MTLPTDYLNATSSWDTHPDAHNETNAAINALQAQVDTLEGGGTLALLGENTSSGLVSWTNNTGHNHPSTLTVAGVAGVPILFQFNVALRWGSATSGSSPSSTTAPPETSSPTTYSTSHVPLAITSNGPYGRRSHQHRPATSSPNSTSNSPPPRPAATTNSTPPTTSSFERSAAPETAAAVPHHLSSPPNSLHDGPMPVSTSGLSGWPGTRPSGYVPGEDGGPWTQISNGDTAAFGFSGGSASWPEIKQAGIYTVQIDYQYEVTGTGTPALSLCEIECMDARTYFKHHPWPMGGWGTPNRSVIAGAYHGTVVCPTASGWGGWFRVGLYAPTNSTNQTSYARLHVLFTRLPIAYP